MVSREYKIMPSACTCHGRQIKVRGHHGFDHFASACPPKIDNTVKSGVPTSDPLSNSGSNRI